MSRRRKRSLMPALKDLGRTMLGISKRKKKLVKVYKTKTQARNKIGTIRKVKGGYGVFK